MEKAGDRYYLLDVFTDTPFAGNPLAVFTEASGICAERMQAIATELNLSETVFVGKQTADNRFPIRIFTPGTELPFAGHPVIGTAHLLASLDLADRRSLLVLQAGVGNLEVHFDEGMARFKTARPVDVQPSSLDSAMAAELLGLSASQVVDEPEIASCGLAYHLIELDSLDALEQARPSAASWGRSVSPSGIEQIYLHVRTGDEARRARMFSTTIGSLREDPATGSAASALAGYLAVREPDVGPRYWQIDQGIEMGRPSRIHAWVERDDAMTILIGGRAHTVGEGKLYH
ncbi:trans-2,3-dihydro-3-hydroxyanthranilate isomerase [Chromohalobacter marismortui]|uniref:Trans-2,3-dihydro-3-hydroxyanthranilate isomerase n=1 Tax=Chromohalobacter marismortui TaxID=42055 RepID=A0A4R7NRJ6_9GAMM|nr:MULTISPECIES: PhzF family phenazine biosynthesis protein [Chromohalobacter]MCI0511368.1 PhzF family phenazine biosynthesis protein [Chromohalobacter sp.]MCI0594020.1 PhzF family phenazine biosynthesis protein [Chromohalobacter sp.]TDU23615.1 trans-2,3-dihydro-3-hydroxyanthranilate isomerase [Chromohalobacter marismortui]